ncbi:hypothetical protein ROHU_031424 [Labeo rohita]|uniref:Uncharacterized protein n=1 Tax=Labeo rohita TaxID=84645 RepID=A0A498LNX8_LABRO|nr:hypothetical protein ROHU_031424 [Labeo rohita]
MKMRERNEADLSGLSSDMTTKPLNAEYNIFTEDFPKGSFNRILTSANLTPKSTPATETANRSRKAPNSPHPTRPGSPRALDRSGRHH